MSENYNDDEIIDSSEDTEKKRNKSEKFCFLCRRPESKAGPMIELPNNCLLYTSYIAGIKNGFQISKKNHKIPFKFQNLSNYFRIQVELWVNIFRRLCG